MTQVRDTVRKDSELWPIPQEWEVCKLGDLVDVWSSKRIFLSEYVKEGIPFFRGKEIIELSKWEQISTELFISNEKYEQIKSEIWVPQKWDILLTSVWTLWEPWVVNWKFDFYFKDWNITRIKTSTSINIDPVFFYYYIKSPDGRNNILWGSIWSTQQAITIISLKKLEFPLPPLPEQQAIASILWSLDDKIEVLREQNRTLEKMGQTMFYEYFGKYSMEDELPEGWRVGKLEEIVDINPTYSVKKWSLVKHTDMTQLWTDMTCMYWEIRKFNGWTKFIKHDILLARITPCLENGKTCYVWFLEEWEIWSGSTEYVVLHPTIEDYREFVYHLARDEEFRRYAIWNMVWSSWRQRVSGEIIWNYDLILPDKKIVEKYHETTNQNIIKIWENYFEIQSLTQIRDSLLPRLMSGIVRVI